jgi:phosphoglycolate phosphatase-like HAD superfamily hydrolase
MRLVLFDVDGTLVGGGPAKEAFHTAMVATFGTAGDIEVHSFAGKTDPQIARELLTGAGLDDREVDRGLPTLWERYLEELEARLAGRPMEVLAGVPDLVRALESTGAVALGLVTGNIAGGARLKLGSVGLAPHFRVGSYGSDDEVRNHLPGIAMRRAREVFGRMFSPRDVVIVGDTPRDVECGRHEGTRTFGVATGHYGPRALCEAGADDVAEDLSDTETILEALLRA